MTTAGSALFGLLAAGAVAAAVGASRVRGAAMPWAAFAALCAQWASFWGLPPIILQVVGVIESSLHPTMSETQDPRAAAKGGSWGLFGLTYDTAKGLLDSVQAFRAHPAYARWDGTARSLLDPGLSAMVASYYLSTLWHRFGQIMPTIAAYQQGPVTVAHVLARGGNLATDLPPHGREYVAHATAALEKLGMTKAGA